jgi:hypothetical protein
MFLNPRAGLTRLGHNARTQDPAAENVPSRSGDIRMVQEQGGSVSYRFAERIGNLQPSPTVAVSDRVRELIQQGHDVIDLGGGAGRVWAAARLISGATV